MHEARPEYYLHLNARILGQAEQLEQKTLLTICNVCTLNLRQADIKLKADPELLERINNNLRDVGAAPYAGAVEVRHLLWEIAEGEGYERLKEIAEKPLEGVRIAPFYGCQILRPSKLLGFEDPDRPQSLERIIEACGAEPVDYPSKIKCCGFPIVLAREEVALGELIQPLAEAKEAGADAMVTPCPLCHLSLDAWQGKAATRGRHRVRHADLPPRPARRRGGGAHLRRAAVQAAHHQDASGDRQDLRGAPDSRRQQRMPPGSV